MFFDTRDRDRDFRSASDDAINGDFRSHQSSETENQICKSARIPCAVFDFLHGLMIVEPNTIIFNIYKDASIPVSCADYDLSSHRTAIKYTVANGVLDQRLNAQWDNVKVGFRAVVLYAEPITETHFFNIDISPDILQFLREWYGGIVGHGTNTGTQMSRKIVDQVRSVFRIFQHNFTNGGKRII